MVGLLPCTNGSVLNNQHSIKLPQVIPESRPRKKCSTACSGKNKWNKEVGVQDNF